MQGDYFLTYYILCFFKCFFLLEFVTPQLKSIYWVVSEKFSYNYIQMNVWKTVGIYWMIAVETDVFWSSRGKTSIFFYYLLCLQGDACPKPPAANQPSFRLTSYLDYLLRGASKCGIYKLYEWNSFPAYFGSEMWAWYCMDIGDVMECWLSLASSFYQISFQVYR